MNPLRHERNFEFTSNGTDWVLIFGHVSLVLLYFEETARGELKPDSMNPSFISAILHLALIHIAAYLGTFNESHMK